MSAEIAHEALIIQWPWLQRTLKTDASDVRRLDRLMSRSAEWCQAPLSRKTDYLATGAERETLSELVRERIDWVASVDREFVDASNQSYQAELDEKQNQLQAARRNELAALTALAAAQAGKHPVNAAKLALATWPRDSDDITLPKLPATLDALGEIVPNLRERQVLKNAERFAVFNPDGTRIVTGFKDNTVRVWDAASGTPIAELRGHESWVNCAAFSPDGRWIVTASADNTARLWDATSGNAIATLTSHHGAVTFAAFSPDGTRLVTASQDKTARLWNALSGPRRRCQMLRGGMSADAT
jgi:WD domain, G-beta repeat